MLHLMKDDFHQLLEDLKDPALYECWPARVVFDAHEETDAQGKVVRRFDRASLEQIARASNARAAQGALCPLTIGHTLSNVPEGAQPPIIGYALNFRVGDSTPAPGLGTGVVSKPVLTADFYIRKDVVATAKTYPRVSVEVWPEDWVIDPVALLRRTPRRDLPQWTYALDNRGKPRLRYSMEDYSVAEDLMTPPPAPAAAPPAAEPSHEEMAQDFARHCMSHKYARHLMKRYGMEEGGEPPLVGPLGNDTGKEPLPGQHSMSAPSATNTKVPEPGEKKEGKEKEPDKHARDGMPAQYAAEMARMAKIVEEMQQRELLTLRRGELQALQGEGYLFDLEEELKDVLPLGAEQYARHLSKIRRCYAHALHTDMVPVAGPDEGPAATARTRARFIDPNGGLTKEGVAEAIKYQRDQGGLDKCSWEAARAYILKTHGGRN